MNKESCNVLYESKLPLKVGDLVFDISVGYFKDKKTAWISTEILTKIFEEIGKEQYNISFIARCKLKEWPFVEGQRRALINDSLCGSVDEFIKKNIYVIDYTYTKGEKELQEKIAYSQKEIDRRYLEDKDALMK